jgi:hypothetical protein
VLHAGEHGHAELLLQRRPRLLGDLVERIRVLDAEPTVALDEVGQQLGTDGPAATDVGVVRRDVGQLVRAPVGHEHDREIAHNDAS